DGFRWMLGTEAASVSCRTHTSPAIRCRGETDALAQIAFANGAGAQLIESFSSPVSRTETVVIGEEGVLVLNYQGALLFDPEHRKEPKERWDNPYSGGDKPESAYRCLEELLAAVEEGRAPTNSGEDNLKTVALLEGAYRSAETGQGVPFRPGGLL
ncbi:MAG: gfo/Idh/MocA family oxidoreductase, partial [Armatimonadetes bacterium]|nr:gfo/Idh/MocA family oxidoreductase [Armatimonadota bacterium]